MAGDERVRHCRLCDLNVYNFAELTRDEIRALIARSEGRLCGRLYRRADGTIITRDCPTGLAALRQRMSRFANAGLGALLSMWAFATGCATTGRQRSSIELSVETAATPRPALFTGVVRYQGEPLPGTTVVLRDELTKRELRTVTDVNGAFAIPGQAGNYLVEVALAGFTTVTRGHVQLKDNEVTRAAVNMQAGERAELGITVVAGGLDVDIRDSTISTTFSQDLINKLP